MTNTHLLIEPIVFSQARLEPKPLLIDVGAHQRFEQVHIPEAINVEPKSLLSNQMPVNNKLPEPLQLERLFSQIGYQGNHQNIVVYDDEGGGWAGRFIWTLDVIGHTRYSYLNGGLHAWLKAGLPVSSGQATVTATSPQITIDSSKIVTRHYIETRLNSSDTVIWDARSLAEYSGEQVFARRGGHIPGAINYEWTRAMDQTNGFRLRKEAKAELINLGITPDKEVITHCQSHHRSGFTYLAARILNYPRIKAYDGSWSEWGNLPDTLIEK